MQPTSPRRRSSLGNVLESRNLLGRARSQSEPPAPETVPGPPPLRTFVTALEQRIKVLNGDITNCLHEVATDQTDGLSGRLKGLSDRLTPQVETDRTESGKWLDDMRKVEADLIKLEGEVDGRIKGDAKKAEQPFKTARAKIAADLTRFDKANFGSPPPAELKEAVAVYTEARPLLDKHEKAGDFVRALAALGPVSVGIKFVKDALPAVEAKIQEAEKLGKAAADYEKVKALKAPAQKVNTAVAKALLAQRADDFAGVYTALDEFAAAREELRQATATQLLTLGEGKGKKSDTRKQAVAFLKADPGMLKNLAAQKPAGPQLLDDLVEDMGGKAPKDDDKLFVGEALKARYGIDKLDGKMSTKALPRLYKVFGMVPPSHTTENPRLKTVNRKRVIFESSDYDSDTNAINLSLGRTGGVLAWGQDLVTSAMPSARIKTGKGKAVVSHFDRTTLHEIGHAVDEKEQFMNKNQANTKFGGWVRFQPSNLVSVMGDDKGFYKKFASYPREFLREYLTRVTQKKDMAGEQAKLVTDFWAGNVQVAAAAPTAGEMLADPGIQAAETSRAQFERAGWDTAGEDAIEAAYQTAQKAIKLRGPGGVHYSLARKAATKILREKRPAAQAAAEILADVGNTTDPNAQPDWKALTKHDAVAWFKAVALSGEDDGLWDGGSSSAGKNAVGDTVYQQAYTSEWWAYKLSSRGNAVSSYQYRSPAEWFAEAYAAYYLKKLPDGHPLAVWLKEQEPPKK